MYKNKFLATVLMSLCMVLCVMFFNTLSVEAADGTLQYKEDGKFYYYEGDKWISDKHGFVDYDGSKFLVAHGVVATEISGLAIDPDNESNWYYLSGGLVQGEYTGLVEYDGEWFYVSKGKLDTTINAYVQYDGGLFFVAVGRIVKEQNGLAKDPNGDDWYYVAGGQAQIQYSGLAGYDGEFFYVQQGKLQKDFNGTVGYNGGNFRITDGQMTEQVYNQKLEIKLQIHANYDANGVSTGYTIAEKENDIYIKSSSYDPNGKIYSSYVCDENGNLTHLYNYDENGKAILINHQIFDENNNIVEQFCYKEDGSLDYHMVSTKDSAGNVIEKELIFENDKYISSIHYTYAYDDKGNNIERTMSYNDEEPSNWAYMEYDSNGNMTKEASYGRGVGGEGKVLNWENIFTYDARGKILEERYITYYEEEPEEAVPSSIFKYKYDSNGIFIGNEIYNSKEVLESYTVLEYDTDGNMVSTIRYSADGKVLGTSTYTYVFK